MSKKKFNSIIMVMLWWMSFELYNVQLFTELLPGIVWMADLIDFWSSIPIKISDLKMEIVNFWYAEAVHICTR